MANKISAIEKITGQTKKPEKIKEKKDVLTKDFLWTVEKKGCGVCLMNGFQVLQLMNKEEKEKARKGAKMIQGEEYVFTLFEGKEK